MLVPSMTKEEIRKEFDKDFEIVFRKASYVSHKLERSLSSREKEQGHVSFFEYYSKYKNKWMYRVNITKKDIIVFFMVFYDTPKGHMAITRSEENNLIFHTQHFFERFNERCSLGLTSYKEIVRAFMNDSTTYAFQQLEIIDTGVRKFFGITPSGATLGIQNEKLRIFVLNTFISNAQLRNDQKEFQKQLNITLDKYVPFTGDYF